MCKFESSQKDESRWQSTDSSKAYRNTSAFKRILVTFHFIKKNAVLIVPVIRTMQVVFMYVYFFIYYSFLCTTSF